MSLRYSLALALLLATAGSGPQTWRIRDTPTELRPVVARADLMIASLHDAMLRELGDEFAAGGADVAIRSCHIDTVLMTYRLGREGSAAGRTSDRLRNPTNTPPWWATDIVKANAGHRARDVEGYAVDLGDRLGVIRPIAERAVCANCHGPSERLSPAVRAALAERYPADQATGFAEGEIRGWFWVEIAKPR